MESWNATRLYPDSHGCEICIKILAAASPPSPSLNLCKRSPNPNSAPAAAVSTPGGQRKRQAIGVNSLGFAQGWHHFEESLHYKYQRNLPPQTCANCGLLLLSRPCLQLLTQVVELRSVAFLRDGRHGTRHALVRGAHAELQKTSD